MTTPSVEEVTALLQAWSQGDQAALERLTPLVYDELRRLARRYMARERPGHTLQTTALVNEAYLRLVDVNQMHWQNRAHFFALSAQFMRRILVDFARTRQAQKRGGSASRVSLAEVLQVTKAPETDLVALDEALRVLATIDQRKSQIVELRFFGGMSLAEVGAVLGLSPATVLREWNKAKAWLYRELKNQ